MTINDFFGALRDILLALVGKGYGDNDNAQSDTKTLPVDASQSWNKIISIPRKSIVILENVDAANELQYTWLRGSTRGATLASGESQTLDGVEGMVYARASDAALTSTVHFEVIPMSK